MMICQSVSHLVSRTQQRTLRHVDRRSLLQELTDDMTAGCNTLVLSRYYDLWRASGRLEQVIPARDVVGWRTVRVHGILVEVAGVQARLDGGHDRGLQGPLP